MLVDCPFIDSTLDSPGKLGELILFVLHFFTPNESLSESAEKFAGGKV